MAAKREQMRKFKEFYLLREGLEEDDEKNNALKQPVKIKADPPIKLPNELKRLVEAFKKSGEVEVGVKEIDPKLGEKPMKLKKKSLFLVGGAVRDFLLGKTPRGGFDLATDAHPTEVERILQAAKIPCHSMPAKGAVKVTVGSTPYEIHTFKKNPKGKGPEIGELAYGSLEDDAKSRDFTINSIYYDLMSDTIIDPSGGMADLKAGKVKFNGDHKKHLEDRPLSGARYLRMQAMLDKDDIDPKVAEDLGKLNIDQINPKDLADEFKKGLDHPDANPSKLLSSYKKTGLLKHVLKDVDLNDEDLPPVKDKKLLLAFLLKGNKDPDSVAEKLNASGLGKDAKDVKLLLKMLNFNPAENPSDVYKLKQDHMTSGLTRRKIKDWAEMMGLDNDVIDKFLDYKLSVPKTVKDPFGEDTLNPVLADDEEEDLDDDDLLEKIASLEGENFLKSLLKY